MHKKKKTVDKSDDCIKTSSSISYKPQKKMRKDKERTEEIDEWSVTKLVDAGSTAENVHNTLTEETSASCANRKSGKRRKRSHFDKSNHSELTTQHSADAEAAACSVKKKKKKAGRDAPANVNTEHSDSAGTSSCQYRALEYLHTWKSAYDSWTFQKVRQVWLLQHMYDPTKIGENDFGILLEYLEKLVGKARESTVEAAEKMIREAEDADENNDLFLSSSEDVKDSQDTRSVCWGRMFPLGSSCTAFDLIGESYTFGRGETCDYQFSTDSTLTNPCYQAYSKVHFKVVKATENVGTVVFVHDLSINGTFLNGTKIGKGSKQALMNNDEISLVLPKNKVFVYMDMSANTDVAYPPELCDNYKMSRSIGRGAFGEVRLAFVNGSCEKVAVKVIDKKCSTATATTGTNHRLSVHMMNEVKILKSVHHPCIISVKDVIDTSNTLYIVMELVEGGELFDRVVASGHLKESICKLLVYQVVVGVKYLHDKDISHRDLKPENILLVSHQEETLVKVTDFGMSKFIDSNTMLKTFCGTPNYLAPEVLQTAGSGSYTKAVDCWSLGVILFICLAGYPPFSPDRGDKPLQEQILTGDYQRYMREAFWDSISDNAKDVVRCLLCVDPMKRITLSQLLQHPWFNDEEMLSKASRLMYPDTPDGDTVETQTPSPKRKLSSPRRSPSKKLKLT